MKKQLRSSSKSDAISLLSSFTEDDHGRYYSTRHNGNTNLISSSNCTTATGSAITANTHCIIGNDCHVQQRYKLLAYADVKVCRVPRGKNPINKICFSSCFRRWQGHQINLKQSDIVSATSKEYLDKSIAYADIEDISVWSEFKLIGWYRPFRIRIVKNNCIYFFQVNTLHLRDQLFYSIQWKLKKFQYERILCSLNSPKVLLTTITDMIDFMMKTPIQDVEVHHFPLEIISEILLQQQVNLPDLFRENVIEQLAPLLEKSYPSPEVCDVFSRYCRDRPRSRLVIETYTRSVEKFLKHKTDFNRCPRIEALVQEYLIALSCQNDGFRVVEDFIKWTHGPPVICPFIHMHPNFIFCCLTGINNFFKDRKQFYFDDKKTYRLYEERTESQLVYYAKVLETISTFHDWRHHLGSILQVTYFPDETLTHGRFIEIFKNVVKNIAEDTRCEVHRTVLGIHLGEFEWFEMFGLDDIVCNNDDNTEMFLFILNKLISCCCRRKRFLLTINKLLPSLMLLASGKRETSLNILCAMLELEAVENHDNKSQLISILKSTPRGSEMYARVCARQRALQRLQQKGGPTALTLPSGSTDNDLAELLSTGPFSNLEYLNLAFTNITSACAEHLIKLPTLTNLDLWSTRFGDAGLEIISEHLNQLVVLNLNETRVTNKGLTYLASMKTLQYLSVCSTHVTGVGIQILKEKLSGLSCDTRYTDSN